MTPDEIINTALEKEQRSWLITGVAGFIGSNLLETLLRLDQNVVGLDNLATGFQRNLDEVESLVLPAQWSRFKFINGDIRNLDDCKQACDGVEIVLHQAALGSVPRSVVDPISTNATNIDGFLNMLIAARDTNQGAGVRRFVYAASSSTYGDQEDLPKMEDLIGRPMSPYAVTKYVNELYAGVFARSYRMPTIGLRYFNVFGPRQDPAGAYAAVIPRWIASMVNGEPVIINGDGQTSRDFCYIENTVQANLLAALSNDPQTLDQVYNVAVGHRTSLNELFAMIKDTLMPQFAHLANCVPQYQAFRSGDVRHSLASIEKARSLLGYQPHFQLNDGLKKAMPWYLNI